MRRTRWALPPAGLRAGQSIRRKAAGRLLTDPTKESQGSSISELPLTRWRNGQGLRSTTSCQPGLQLPLDRIAVLGQCIAMINEDRPVYLRLRDTIAAMILDGKVTDGDPLPSVRSLAAEYGANPLTVAKAYQTFQDEGFVIVKRGVGMFVADGATTRLLSSERQDFLNNRWPAIAAHVRRLGLDVEDLLERVPA